MAQVLHGQAWAEYADPRAVEFLPGPKLGWLDGSVACRSFIQKNDPAKWELWTKTAYGFVHKWVPEGLAYYAVAKASAVQEVSK